MSCTSKSLLHHFLTLPSRPAANEQSSQAGPIKAVTVNFTAHPRSLSLLLLISLTTCRQGPGYQWKNNTCECDCHTRPRNWVCGRTDLCEHVDVQVLTPLVRLGQKPGNGSLGQQIYFFISRWAGSLLGPFQPEAEMPKGKLSLSAAAVNIPKMYQGRFSAPTADDSG